MAELIDPKEVTIKMPFTGEEKTFIISRIPAYTAREVMIMYPQTLLMKTGEYQTNEKLSKTLLSYVAVQTDNGPIRLTTEALVNSHVKYGETVINLEKLMAEYNFSFFNLATISSFWLELKRTAMSSISGISTAFSGVLSQATKPRSKS